MDGQGWLGIDGRFGWEREREEGGGVGWKDWGEGGRGRGASARDRVWCGGKGARTSLE